MTTTYNHLGAEERGAIMAMKLGGMSARSIGQSLARAPSTITRELLRGYQGKTEGVSMGRPRIAGGYDAIRAGKRARRVRRAARRSRKLSNGSALWCRVRSLLDDFWSPQQIAAILKQEHPGQAVLASLARNHLHRHLCTAQRRIAQGIDLLVAPESWGAQGTKP